MNILPRFLCFQQIGSILIWFPNSMSITVSTGFRIRPLRLCFFAIWKYFARPISRLSVSGRVSPRFLLSFPRFLNLTKKRERYCLFIWLRTWCRIFRVRSTAGSIFLRQIQTKGSIRTSVIPFPLSSRSFLPGILMKAWVMKTLNFFSPVFLLCFPEKSVSGWGRRMRSPYMTTICRIPWVLCSFRGSRMMSIHRRFLSLIRTAFLLPVKIRKKHVNWHLSSLLTKTPCF